MEKISNILLIDDDYASNFLHKIFLQRLKTVENIHTANNGKQALETLFDANLNPLFIPEIIFLDINMPIMNGWEFLEEYQKIVGTPKSKIIMLSASANPEDERLGKDHPCVFQFVGKPLNEQKLKIIINAINENNILQ